MFSPNRFDRFDVQQDALHTLGNIMTTVTHSTHACVQRCGNITAHQHIYLLDCGRRGKCDNVCVLGLSQHLVVHFLHLLLQRRHPDTFSYRNGCWPQGVTEYGQHWVLAHVNLSSLMGTNSPITMLLPTPLSGSR